jgi:hypothetical protein
MAPELEKYYETYWDLFSRPGWDQFVKDLESAAEGVQHIVDKADAPDVFRAQGELACIKRLINFKSLLEDGYDQILKDEAVTPE